MNQSLTVRLAVLLAGSCSLLGVLDRSATVGEAQEIALRIVADRHVERSREFEVVGGQVAVFGRSVRREYLQIDPCTLGVADVFVWTACGEQNPNKDREPRTLALALVNGNYWPRTLVSRANDFVQFSPLDPVADMLESDFEAGLLHEYHFKLDEHFDKPKRIMSRQLYWRPTTWVFVSKDTVCSSTDRLGEASLDLDAKDGAKIDVHLWHPELKELNVIEVSAGAELIKPGLVRLDTSVSQELDVTVEVEDE